MSAPFFGGHQWEEKGADFSFLPPSPVQCEYSFIDACVNFINSHHTMLLRLMGAPIRGDQGFHMRLRKFSLVKKAFVSRGLLLLEIGRKMKVSVSTNSYRVARNPSIDSNPELQDFQVGIGRARGHEAAPQCVTAHTKHTHTYTRARCRSVYARSWPGTITLAALPLCTISSRLLDI